jgi:Protein of unknown function (DUF4079)
MDLPSFLWLWRIAAWSMGLSLTFYGCLVITGGAMRWCRRTEQPRPLWLRPLHWAIGAILVTLVLILLSIGIIGTLGEYGSLGHSWHLLAGLTVVALVLASAWSALRIDVQRPWARKLHLSINGLLGLAFLGATYSGWQVVQKYLP